MFSLFFVNSSGECEFLSKGDKHLIVNELVNNEMEGYYEEDDLTVLHNNKWYTIEEFRKKFNI